MTRAILRALAFAGALTAGLSSAAVAQQAASGTVQANASASAAPMRATTATAWLDRWCGSTSGFVLSRGASSWGCAAPGATSGVQPYDAELTAIAGLTSAAGKVPYFTGTATASTFDSTSYGRSLSNAANATALRTLAASQGYIALNAKSDCGATGDGTTNDRTNLQACIDALPALTGGKIFFPAGVYNLGGSSGLNILIHNVTLEGVGSDQDESGLTSGATVLSYTGAGAAITLGASGMASTLYGTVIKGMEIVGTSACDAGVLFEYNSGGGFFPARSTIENVVARGCSTGSGLHVKFSVDLRLNHFNVWGNKYGVKVDAATTVYVNYSQIWGNITAGFYTTILNGLFVNQTIFESNSGPGLWAPMTDDSKVWSIQNSWFENNNIVSGTCDYQLCINNASHRLTNVDIGNINLEAAQQNKDILLIGVDYSLVHNIRSTASSIAINYGTDTTNGWRHNIYNTSTGTIDTGDQALDFQPRSVVRKSGGVAPAENLKVVYASASTVTSTADAIMLAESARGRTKKFFSLNSTANVTTSGPAANGRDSATAEANSTWYHIWAQGKEDGTISTTLSTSTTTPTLTSGYIYSGYIGAVYNDSGGNFVSFSQHDNFVDTSRDLTTNQVLSTGASTTYANISLAGAVPATAKAAKLEVATNTSSGTAAIGVYIASSGSGTSAIYGSQRHFNPAGGTVPFGLPFGFTDLTTAQQVDYYVFGTNARADVLVTGWRY